MSLPLPSLNVIQKEQTFGAAVQAFDEHFFDGAGHVLQSGEAATTCPDCYVRTALFHSWESIVDGTTKLVDKPLIASVLVLGDTRHLLPKQAVGGVLQRLEEQEFFIRKYVRAPRHLGQKNLGIRTVDQIASLLGVVYNNFKWALGDVGIRRVKITGASEPLGTEVMYGRMLVVTGVVEWPLLDTVGNP